MTQARSASFDPLAFFAQGSSDPNALLAAAVSPIFSYERSGDPFGGALSAIPGVSAPKSPFTLGTEEELKAALEGFAASRPGQGSAQGAVGAPPPPPEGAFDPQQTQTPGGSASAGAQSDAQAEALRRLVELQEKLGSIPYLKEKTALETQAQLERAQGLTESALLKQQEVTRRKVEEAKIQAWQNVTTAQINREAQMATSLAQLAYLANQPNAAVLTAMSPFTQSAAQAGKITVV